MHILIKKTSIGKVLKRSFENSVRTCREKIPEASTGC